MDQQIRLLDDVPAMGWKRGQTVLASQLPADVHDPGQLSTYLAGYSNAEHRADELSPVILHDKDSDKYRQFTLNNTFKRVNVKIAHTAHVREVDPETELPTFTMVPRAIASFVPFQTQAAADVPYNARAAAARRCANVLKLDRELDVVRTLLGTTTTFNANNRIALGAGFNWNGGASSNPIKNLMDLNERSAAQIACYAMNPTTAGAFIREASVKDHIRSFIGDSGIAGMMNQLGQLERNPTMMIDFAIPAVGVVKVFAAKILNETSGVLEYILEAGKVIAVARPPGVPRDGEEIATSYTWRFKGPSGTGWETREVPIETRGPFGGILVIASQMDIAVATSSVAGGIITGATA